MIRLVRRSKAYMNGKHTLSSHFWFGRNAFLHSGILGVREEEMSSCRTRRFPPNMVVKGVAKAQPRLSLSSISVQ